MKTRFAARLFVMLALVTFSASAAYAQGTQTAKPFEPTVGQPGKDVVWVPTPEALVAKMLDLAKVTPQDLVMDLGSGDGRTVIAAAKRGARAIGVEYNPNMVELAQRNAKAAGVSDRATFIRGDIFETDFSKATVITLFLLDTLNQKLRPTLLNMRPGTRVVSNTFRMGDWEPDAQETLTDDCNAWCTALLWIVPAKVEGSWQLGSDTLTLDQQYQMLSGTLGSGQITEGRLNGAEISFTVGGTKYTGRVDGNTMSGTTSGGGSWKATKRG